jgi:Rod binding domain-containing protein
MDGIGNDLAAKAVDAMRGLDAAKATRAAGSDAAKAAEMFEDLLATTLVRELRRGLPEGFFGAGPGSDVYEGWLDEHVGRALSRSHALDLAQAIRTSLGAKQEPAKANEGGTR